MSNANYLKQAFDTGFKHGFGGREKMARGDVGAFRAFLDGLLGARLEDEAYEAYEEGYRLGNDARRSPRPAMV